MDSDFSTLPPDLDRAAAGDTASLPAAGEIDFRGDDLTTEEMSLEVGRGHAIRVGQKCEEVEKQT